eukprot:757157-Hanusia_phi.AAC.1
MRWARRVWQLVMPARRSCGRSRTKDSRCQRPMQRFRPRSVDEGAKQGSSNHTVSSSMLHNLLDQPGNMKLGHSNHPVDLVLTLQALVSTAKSRGGTTSQSPDSSLPCWSVAAKHSRVDLGRRKWAPREILCLSDRHCQAVSPGYVASLREALQQDSDSNCLIVSCPMLTCCQLSCCSVLPAGPKYTTWVPQLFFRPLADSFSSSPVSSASQSPALHTKMLLSTLLPPPRPPRTRPPTPRFP